MAAGARRRCRSRGGRPAAAPTSSAITSSTRSVPAPARASVTEPHSGHDSGARLGVAAVVAAQRSPARWRTSETSQRGHYQARPHARQDEVRRPAAAVDQHDRLAAALGAARASAARVRGVQRPLATVALAHVEDLDRAAAARPSTRCGELEPLEREPALGPRRRRAARRARRRRRRRGGGRPRARRSAGRPPACRRRRAPRRRRSGRGPRSGRRPPSAARRRSAPRRGAAAATRRGARRRRAREWRTATRSPKRAANARQRLRRQPDLGDEHDRPAAALERRLGRGEVDLGLARAGDAVQEQLAAAAPSSAATIRSTAARWAGSRLDPPRRGADRDRRRAPAHLALGRARRGRARSSRRSASRADARGRERGRASSAARARRAARAPRAGAGRAASPSPSAARPAAVIAATELGARPGLAARARRPGRQHELEPARRRRAVLARRPRARARRARRGTPASSASIGSASRSGGSALRSASSTTTPSSRRRPNGTTQHACRPRPRRGAREPVVERARAARGRSSAARPWRSPSAQARPARTRPDTTGG